MDAGRALALIDSLLGGKPETQEFRESAAQHGVTCDIEMLNIKDLNETYERMKRSDARYRFVIDMETIKC